MATWDTGQDPFNYGRGSHFFNPVQFTEHVSGQDDMGEGLSWTDVVWLISGQANCMSLFNPVSALKDWHLGEGGNCAHLVHGSIPGAQHRAGCLDGLCWCLSKN